MSSVPTQVSDQTPQGGNGTSVPEKTSPEKVPQPSAHHAAVKNEDPCYDTIIIGAGMSGIAAGIRLAYYDQRVCILEKHNTIGGLNSFYRMNRRDYDVGLHAVTNFTEKGARKGPFSRILRQLRFKWEDFALAPQRRYGSPFRMST